MGQTSVKDYPPRVKHGASRTCIIKFSEPKASPWLTIQHSFRVQHLFNEHSGWGTSPLYIVFQLIKSLVFLRDQNVISVFT